LEARHQKFITALDPNAPTLFDITPLTEMIINGTTTVSSGKQPTIYILVKQSLKYQATIKRSDAPGLVILMMASAFPFFAIFMPNRFS
jgi:hypothetical protein